MHGALFLLLLQACPPGNLAQGKPADGTGLRGSPAVVTDGYLAPEGSFWEGPASIIMAANYGQVTIDLGAVYPIRALLLQADNNDVYHVEGSADAFTWREIWVAPPRMDMQGLRTRFVQLRRPAEARYLRVFGSDGDLNFSLSEVRAYCQLPTPWPPAIVMPPGLRWWHPYDWWRWVDNPRMVGIKGGIAVLGGMLLVWGIILRIRGRPDAHQKLRDRALAVLGGLAFLCFWNLGHFHFNNYIHIWEHYHHYMGAKYFRELGYSRLYQCTAIADAELGGFMHKKLRNLVSNHLESAELTLADPNVCKSHFSVARWEAYKHDIAYFRTQFSRDRWEEAQRDHGYNHTPMWSLTGGVLANLRPASQSTVYLFAIFDPLTLCLMWALVWRAFGWRAMCVALLWWGTNYPARFWWNGGGFLRMDWLVISMIGICLVKRGRMAGGGFLLTFGALLRIFPGFIVVGLMLKALMRIIRARKWVLAPEHKKFALGCITGMALLVPLSAALAGGGHRLGLDAWIGSGSGEEHEQGFIENSAKHLKTALTNNMGLHTVLSWEEKTRAIHTRNYSLEDPFDTWKAARRQVFEDRKLLFFALVVGFLVLLARAVEKHEDWVALSLGIGLIPVAAELTCYYYSVMLGLGFLYAKREGEGVAAGLLWVSALTCLLPGIFWWDDDAFTWISLVIVLYVAAAAAYMGAVQTAPQPAAAEAPPEGEKAAATAPARATRATAPARRSQARRSR